MQSSQNRRSERVNIVFPVEVLGADSHGRRFSEEARTSVISRHGAVIVLKHHLAVNQELTVRFPGNKTDAEIRIVGLLGKRPIPTVCTRSA